MQLAQEDHMVLIKGKRSKRPRPPSPLALTMATSSSTTNSGGGATSEDISGGSDHDRVVTLSLSPSNSCYRFRDEEEEEDMAKCLILLARGTPPPPPQATATATPEGYQCKTCNKSFPSFQALGGHRASHKRPIKTDQEKKAASRDYNNKQEFSDESRINLSLQIPGRNISNKAVRVHECSICGAEFASGQALGGHMRRHRPLPAPAGSGSHGGESSSQETKRSRNNLLPALDLNLPAPEDDHDDHQRESNYPFAISNKRVIVFSASPLVDCHI